MQRPFTQRLAEASTQSIATKDHVQVPHAPPMLQTSSPFLIHLPYDCRLIIYQYLLRTRFTRIERWHSPSIQASSSSLSAAFSYPQPLSRGADEVPYRLAGSGAEEEERGLGLKLMLSCRQIYIEVIEMRYSATTFIFSLPQDITRFLELAPVAGLQHLRSVILAYGRVDWRAGGPIYDYHPKDDTLDPSRHWEDAFDRLATLPSLQNLEVWLSHRNHLSPLEARRPRESFIDEETEQRHRNLFEILGRVKGVKEITVRLSWNPVDILEGLGKEGKKGFNVNLMSADEMGRRKVAEGWPVSRGLEGCD